MMIVFFTIFLTTSFVHTFESDGVRINQKIIVGPNHIDAHSGETIQFPCIVSKQSNAIVTWCWNDFCTLGKTQFLRRTNVNNELINIYQYTAYPRFQLLINERLNHYNLSIEHVSQKDEGIFQCQVQRTMYANEARSERVRLTMIAPPTNKPTLILPIMPLKQGHPVDIICLSSPSKPASELIFYRNDQIIKNDLSDLTVEYEYDVNTKKNSTKLIYTIDDPDSNWHNSIIRCKQIYKLSKNTELDVSGRLEVLYKPKVRIESQNRYPLIVNSTATFRCIVHGNPEPRLRWFANSMDLTALTSSIINIPLSRHVHNNSIGCTATNSIGITNSSVRLLVRYPPILISHPPKFLAIDLDSKIGSNPKNVRCIVDSYPRAKIKWYRYGKLLSEGSFFNLENITQRDQQGFYSYHIETAGFQTIKNDFMIYLKGKPLIYIQEFGKHSRIYECQVYSSSRIYSITWKLNEEMIQSNKYSSISTTCNDYRCISKLIYDYRIKISSSKTLNHLSCLAENEFGIEQSRLYHINTSDDLSSILIPIFLFTLLLIVILSLIAIYCCCRSRKLRKKDESTKNTKIPAVYDEHYSINELIKEVGSLRTCNATLTNNDLSTSKIESTDRLLTPTYNKNVKYLLDDMSNGSTTNSSGFHSKSTTTIFNHEYSPRLFETVDLSYSGLSPLYSYQYPIDV